MTQEQIKRKTNVFYLGKSIDDIRSYVPGCFSMDRIGHDIKTIMEKLLLYNSQEQLPGMSFLPRLICDMYNDLLELIEQKIKKLTDCFLYYSKEIEKNNVLFSSFSEREKELYIQQFNIFKKYLEFMNSLKILYTDMMETHISPTEIVPKKIIGLFEPERIMSIYDIDEKYILRISEGFSHYQARLSILYGLRRGINYVKDECKKAGADVKIIFPDFDLEGIQMRLRLLERESSPF